MLDRQLLKDIGFTRGRGRGWDHEVWCYGGWFWVHYKGKFSGLQDQQVDGNKVSRKRFFKMFLAALESNLWESLPREFED